MEIIKGIAASNGITIGKAYLWRGGETPAIPRYTFRRQEDSEKEWARFIAAVKSIVKHKTVRLRTLEDKSGKVETAIIKSQIMMLEDIELHDHVRAHLFEKKENVEWAVRNVSHNLVQTLYKTADNYLRERAADITGVANELLYQLLGIKRQSLSALTEKRIVVARDILPAEAITMNKRHVQAIALDAGSTTSHTAILARSFEIPAVVGLGSITKKVKDGDTVIVDATHGEVYINPEDDIVKEHQKKIRAGRRSRTTIDPTLALEAETPDGTRFSVKANIELPADAAKAYKYGAEGIGLFRSEFLFFSSSLPAEEETQYRAYSKVIKASAGKPVTIRTSDIGGDKILPQFFNAVEQNPLLGWRAIRVSLASPDVFKTQLRAILRASVYGPTCIMFPMIATVEELKAAITHLDEAKDECRARKQNFDQNIKIGTMIEIPSAALIAPALAALVDFFSIGTNDLLQYTLAVDRGNEKINYLADPRHPALLRLIKMTIEAAENARIPVSVCGQIAADETMVPLLAGLGMREFSMNAVCIPKIKAVIRGLDLAQSRARAEKAVLLSSAAEVGSLCAAGPSGA